MEFVVFTIVSAILLTLQILIGNNTFKDTIAKIIGEKLFKSMYRILYISLSIIIYVICLKLYVQLPKLILYNMEDSVSNLIFLIIDTIRVISLFFVIEALWELDLFEFLGLKQLWYTLTRKDLSLFKRNRIRKDEFAPKGLYLRHRQPVLFYMILFFALDRQQSLNNLLFMLIFIPYYHFSSQQQEQRLSEDYGDSYKSYQQKVSKYWPKFKRFDSLKPKK